MDATRKTARKWIDSLSTRVQQVLVCGGDLSHSARHLLAGEFRRSSTIWSVGDVAPKTITAMARIS